MKRRLIFAIGVGVFVGCLAASVMVTSAQPSKETPRGASSTDRKDLQIRYARACLELAKIEVLLREQANKRTPDTYAPSELEHYRANVRLASEQVRLAEQPKNSDADFVSVYLLRAEERAQRAKQAYSDALEHKRLDPAYGKLKLRRLELEAERAQLRVAMWQDAGDSLLDHVHWELDRVSEELLTLEQKVDNIINQIGQGGE